MDSKSLILEPAKVKVKLERMAWQILERCSGEDSIVLAGIATQGYHLAKELATRITAISSVHVHLLSIGINKKDLIHSEVQLDKEAAICNDKVVFVVDDVLNTGKTLLHGIGGFLQTSIKSLFTVVLVNREHNLFPVRADVFGMELSTTLREHIEVVLDDSGFSVYLV